MRFSLWCMALSLHTFQLVAAHAGDDIPAQSSLIHRCGCQRKHGKIQAGGGLSTFATVVVSSHRCTGSHHMTYYAASPSADGSVAAPTVVQAPVVNPSPDAAPDASFPPASAVAPTSVEVAPSAAAALSSAALSVAAPSVAVAPAAAPSVEIASNAPSISSALQEQAQASSAPSPVAVVSNAAMGLTADQLIAIMPSSSSCTSATPAGECIAAAQAAPLLTQSFSKYGLNNKGVQAAAIALIALESGELKYIQHYNGASPARTGQGTYNEMSPSFVVEYAKSLYGAGAPSDPVAAMDKVNSSPADSIASAAWFIQAHCGASLISQFASDPEQAWSAYITACIFTPMTDARRQYWNKAKAALGV